MIRSTKACGVQATKIDCCKGQCDEEQEYSLFADVDEHYSYTAHTDQLCCQTCHSAAFQMFQQHVSLHRQLISWILAVNEMK